MLCADGHAERFEPPPGLECLLVVPVARRCAPPKAREALPSRIPVGDAVFNIAHASLLVLGLATNDLGLVARGLRDRIHQPRRAHLYPRSWELVQQAPELGALGATISGAGPTVLVWCDFESTGAVAARLQELAEGWAEVLRVPFTPIGRASAVLTRTAPGRICTRSQTGWRSTARARRTRPPSGRCRPASGSAILPWSRTSQTSEPSSVQIRTIPRPPPWRTLLVASSSTASTKSGSPPCVLDEAAHLARASRDRSRARGRRRAAAGSGASGSASAR